MNGGRVTPPSGRRAIGGGGIGREEPGGGGIGRVEPGKVGRPGTVAPPTRFGCVGSVGCVGCVGLVPGAVLAAGACAGC
ncbi:unannotated protein [freshwater metagenome]|uniref:Unannotated protein n=1 Tax=freshwater metagenome TaxID=449393 RepID=A0A6J6B8K9_9ZZZZ